ncbi:hypothetical protein G7054_g13112 [Neopestalotiopsis clavispora]|nr:hypothetical protein G7054_g13112 [Neopestalotiopsis clavispora]
MRGHRSSGSTSRLIEGDAQFISTTQAGDGEPGLPAKSSAHTAFVEKADGEQAPGGRKLLRISPVTFILFVLAVHALAVTALWYSLSCERKPFDYGTSIGAWENMEAMTNADLINESELDLKTLVAADKPIVRQYNFDIRHAIAAPDGFQKPMILVNGQSPGPLIEANIGDTIRVQVSNMMANHSTTIHWHGINQYGSTWMDGVAGISQCGIPPGQNFTYEFVVKNQRGTFWWHAHLGVQYTDGVYGPIVIRDPDEKVPETDEERIIFVGDLYHTYGSVLLASYLNSTSKWVPSESGVEPLPDNILLNGQHSCNCSVTSTTYPPDPTIPFSTNCTNGQLYRTSIQKNQRVRLRVINSSSFLSYWFSVDNHTLSIVELDGVEIEPISARGVYLNIGQRASVVLVADQRPGNYYLRATLPQTCFLPYAPYVSAALESNGYAARGILSYSGTEDPDAEPIGVRGNVSNPYGVENNGVRGDVWEGCDDMPFDMPKPMRKMDAVEVGEKNYHYIEYAFRQAQDVNRIFINKTAYSPLENNATIWKAVDQDFDTSKEGSYHSWDFGLNQQVLLIPEADKGAQIVINSKDAMEHPWHMQKMTPISGHTFQIVGWGPGEYGTTTTNTGTTWNLQNPMRRDTVTVPAQSHVVLRFAADNPGLWALHCHVAWHMEAGMLVSIAERPADLAAW